MSNLFESFKKFYDIYVLVVGEPKISIQIPSGVTVVSLPDEGIHAQTYAEEAIQKIKERQIDIVIGVTNLFDGVMELYKKCHALGIKTIAANSESYLYPYKNCYFYHTIGLREEIFRRVDIVLWQTNFSATLYGYTNDNGFVMPNPNTFSKQGRLAKKEDDIILSVGRFNDAVKRVDRILACFKQVSNKRPSAKLWLVGPCDRDVKIESLNKSVNEIMDELQLDDSKISFIGEVKNISDYYEKASLLLLTSDSEGFPNVVNEAARFGLPLVCNQIHGIEDLIEDGENGLVSDLDDINGLAKNILKLLQDQKMRNQMGKAASDYVDKFDIKNVTREWIKVIDFLINSPDKKSGAITSAYEKRLQQPVTSSSLSIDLVQTMQRTAIDISQKYNPTVQELETARAESIGLQKEIDRQNKELASIYNSKKWKMLQVVGNVQNAVKIKKAP